MTALALKTAPETALPALVKRAAEKLASATSAAEVLEVREEARALVEAAKIAARFERIQGAAGEVLSAIYHAHADGLIVEAGAKRRLAEEYDIARAAGLVAGEGRPKTQDAVPSIASLPITHDDLKDGRLIRDAEAIDPDAGRRALARILGSNEQPTRAALRQAYKETVNPAGHVVSKRDRPEAGDKDGQTAVAVIRACTDLANRLNRLDMDSIAEAIERIDSGATSTLENAHDRLGKLLEVVRG